MLALNPSKMSEAASGQFERALEDLEKIVARLEREEITLDESVRLFKEGRELAARCERLLADAQKAIEAAMRSGGDDGVVEDVAAR
jgi:exodeoxyribonuclease VII small subunit